MKARLQRPIKCPNEQIPFTDPRIKYPMYASVKYDGYRGLTYNDKFHSPDAKPFSNRDLCDAFAEIFVLATAYDVIFDGEVWHPGITFTELGGRLRAHHGDLSGVEYHIFDVLSVDEWNGPVKLTKYIDRYVRLQAFERVLPSNCRIVHQHTCLNATVAGEKYAAFLASGCEGIILRSPSGLYKNNRCTHRESNCYKFKHFETQDAKIVAVIQRRKLRDDTERTFNPHGLLEKVHHAEAYDLDDAVGAFQIRLNSGLLTSVNLGRGFSYKDRCELWQRRESLVGRTIEFKWMPHGTKDLPRIGNVVRFRPDKD